MIKEYLLKSGQREDVDQLDVLCTQLNQTSTREQVSIYLLYHMKLIVYTMNP